MDFKKYKYKFTGHGFVALGPRSDGSVMVDVGNLLCPGIIDHHQFDHGAYPSGGVYKSTSGLLPVSTHLLPEEVDTFITHRFPDFDAWLAIWLIQYWHENKCFPPCHEKVIEYVTQLDAGMLNVDRFSVRTPAAVAASIPLAVEAGMTASDGPQPYHDLDERLLMRGLALVDYIFTRLLNLPEQNRDMQIPYFMESGCIFETEIALALDDLGNYEKDVQDRECTEQTRVRLRNVKTGNNEYVDALIWKKAPGCALHKHWARSDDRAPGGFGYILTFIPQNDPCENIDTTGPERNRAIISVNPNAPYDLFGLAIELERLELLKEEDIYKDDPAKMRMGEMLRNGSHPRFAEAWCTHDDPWYDGRSDGYTIVDSPRRYSLLTLDEMADAVGSFTIPAVKAAQCRIVYPFSFRTKRAKTGYDQLCEHFSKSGEVRETGLESLEIPAEAFYSHFRDYLHLSGPADAGKTGNCRIFRQESGMGLAYLILFSYGVGFAIREFRDLQLNGDSGPHMFSMEDLLTFNRTGVFAIEEIHGMIKALAGDLPLSFSVEEGLVYCAVEVEDTFLGKEDAEKTLYQVCNLKSYAGSGHSRFQNDIEYAAASAGSFQLRIDSNLSYGFGKAGGCLLAKANDYRDDNARKQADDYVKHFMTIDFVSFLLSLHQRTCLISLSTRLAEYAEKRRSASLVRQLRYFIMEFIAKGWFSQISRNELNMEIYGRWGKIFENASLFNEVNAQLKSYEDYLAGERNRKIGLITSIFVPVSLFEILFSINMLGKAQNGQLIQNIPWYGSLGVLGVLFLLMLSFISFGRKRKKL